MNTSSELQFRQHIFSDQYIIDHSIKNFYVSNISNFSEILKNSPIIHAIGLDIQPSVNNKCPCFFSDFTGN